MSFVFLFIYPNKSDKCFSLLLLTNCSFSITLLFSAMYLEVELLVPMGVPGCLTGSISIGCLGRFLARSPNFLYSSAN